MAFDKETRKSRGPAKGGSRGGSSSGGSRGGFSSPRGESTFGERKPRSVPREGARSSRTEFSDRPKRDFGSRDGAPPRRDSSSFGSRDGARPPRKDFGDRPPRREGSSEDRPRRAYSDRPREGGSSDRPPARREYSSDRPKRDFNDRPPRREGSSEDRPRRAYSDRPREGGSSDRPPARREYSSDRPARSFDDRPKRDFGDRPPRRESGERPSFRKDFGDRPPRRDSSFGSRDGAGGDRPPRREGGSEDRPPRREYSSDRPARSFDDRPPRKDFGDRPARSFDDRPPRREYSADRPQRSRDDSYTPQKRAGFEKRPSGSSDAVTPQSEREDQVASADGASPSQERGEPTMMGHEMLFYGVHAVQAALRNIHRKVTKIWVTESGQERLMEAWDETRHPAPIIVQRRELERRLSEGAVHQGLGVAVEPLQDVFLTDVINPALAKPDERHVVVVLDEVSDPHNVGAVLRSMSAFGAKALIVHKRNAPGVTGVMAKIATGALEHVPMIPVTNLSQALEELKMSGFTVLGLDENADYPIQKAPATGHIALVLGGEGEGLRAKTRTTCNAIVSIETFGDIKSLNVSNAAAIALYSLTQKT